MVRVGTTLDDLELIWRSRGRADEASAVFEVPRELGRREGGGDDGMCLAAGADTSAGQPLGLVRTMLSLVDGSPAGSRLGR